MKSINMVAFDLGAESGRTILGGFDGRRISISEIYRFPNDPVQLPKALHWDALRLLYEIKAGLRMAGSRADGEILSLGIDTWGNDFGFLDREGNLLGNPYHNRDPRTYGMMEYALSRVSRHEIFSHTGIQLMWNNGIYQVIAEQLGELAGCQDIARRNARRPSLLDIADSLLFMPDLFTYFLTGRQTVEWTVASTSQMCDSRARGWARELLERIGIPQHILKDIIQPGCLQSPLLKRIGEQTNINTGYDPPMVVTVAGHDTASAVIAVPTRGFGQGDFVYISSGTWSLMGTEVAEPVIDEKTEGYNFANEGGLSGTYRLLKNISGLWPIQQCRRAWKSCGIDLAYDELTMLASSTQSLRTYIDVDHQMFQNPPDMTQAIQKYCQQTNQRIPESKGEIIRCVLESLALKYRFTLERLEEITGHHYEAIHIVGGGAQNRLLNQLTSDITGWSVLAGPIEATSIGNLLVQAMALGELKDLGEIREVVRDSFVIQTFEPDLAHARWDDEYSRYCLLLTH